MRNLIRIVGSGGKGGSSDTYEADDNMYARQSAAFVDAIAEGEIKGLVYGDASILVDEVRLRDVDQSTGHVSGTTNVNNFSVITAKGTADQTPDPEFFNEFPSASTLQEIGSAELLLNEAQFFTISSGQFEKNNVDYIKITMSTTGMSKLTKKGDSKGDFNTTYVYFNIDFRWIDNDGVAKSDNKFMTGFTGKVSGNYAHTFGFNIEEYKAANGMTDWSIRVTRVGGAVDSDTYEIQNAIYVNSIEASIADKLSYPYTAYVAGVIDAEQFSNVPTRGYEIDGKLIKIPSNHVPIDYNGRKLTVASNVGLAVGDTITQSASISSITATGNADDGYVGTGTMAAHGIPIGKTFQVTIATTASQDEDFYEGAFTATAKTATTFTYKLNRPFDGTDGVDAEDAFKTIVSTTCTGTITGELAVGGEIDKINGTTIYVRDVAASSTILTGQDISNGTVTPNVTAAERTVIPANYRRNASTEKLGTVEYDWDGLFYTTWCNNPAWVFNDLIVNKIYGLGNYLEQIQVNKWELYQIGRYCDELVPAGVAAADLLSIHTTNEADYTGSTGEYEPRFSANLVLSGKAEAFKVLNDVVSIFRGMIYWLNGEAFVVQDSEKDPVYQFTNGNVINGEFKYEGTAKKTRTNQCIVGWNNPQDYYRSRQEIVELEEILQKDDEFLKPDSTTAFGCTSRGQARRLGKWKLLSNKLHTNNITFTTSLNAAFLRPGDIVQVIDQHKDGKSWGGRVTTGSTNSTNAVVKIDRAPTSFATDSPYVESGYEVGDYRITCSFVGYKTLLAQDSATIDIDGTPTSLLRGNIITHYGSTALTTEELSKKVKDTSGNYVFTQWTPFTYTETKTVTGVSSDRKSITVSGVFAETPTVESVWVISRAALTTGKSKYEAKLYRILQISEQEGGQLEIQALDYNATKFDNVDKDEALSQDRTIFLPDSLKVVPAVTNISYSTRLTMSARNVADRNSLTFDWDPPLNSDNTPYTFVRHYEVYYSLDNQKWFKAGDTTSTDITKFDLLDGTYYVRIFTVSLQGKRSAVAEATLIVDFQRAVGPSEGTVGNGEWTINQVGTISSSFGVNAGTGSVSFTPDDYLHNDGVSAHTVTSQPALAFANLSTSATNAANVGYVYFDHSANKFIAIAHDEASDQFYDVNSGSNVFAAATGNITCSTDTGSAATTTPKTISAVAGGATENFDGELGLNNIFSFNDGSTTHYHRVKEFDATSPDTIMRTYNPVNVTRVAGDSQTFNKPRFIVDFAKDTIMGKVTRTGASSWTLERFGISRGEGAYNVNGTNEVHSFAGDASGEVSTADYAAYTNDYTITKDGQSYTYAASGTSPNTFGLALQAKTGFANNADINIDGSGTITIDDNSLDSVSSGTATIRITDLALATTIADRIISFSKLVGGSSTAGTNAKTVRLIASDYSVVYDQDGETPDPAVIDDIILTAYAQNFTNAYFKYEGDGLTNQTVFHDGSVDANKDVYTIVGGDANWQVPADHFSTPKTVTVICQEGSSGGEIARDSITITAVKDGTSNYTVSQSNASHAVPANSDGSSPVMTNSGTVFEVFKGGAKLLPTVAGGVPAAGYFKVTSGTDTNITVSSANGSVTDTYFITYGDHTGSGGLTASTGEIEYAVNCENIQTINVNQTFSRTNVGEAGDPAKTVIVSPSHFLIVKEIDPEPGGVTTTFNPLTVTIQGNTNNLTQNGEWKANAASDFTGTDLRGDLDNIDESPDANGIVSCTIPGADITDGMSIRYELHGDDGGSYDQTTLELVESFTNGITVILTNESHTFITDADGVSNSVYTGSGTDIKVYQGIRLLDYLNTGTPGNGQWKVTVGNATEGTLTEGEKGSQGSTPVRYARIPVHSGAATAVSVFTIPYTIEGKDTYGNDFNHVKYQTLTKAKRGETGDDAKGIQLILGSNEIAFDNSTGTPVLTPAVAVQDIAVSTNLQNITGTPTLTILAADGSAQSPADVLFTNGAVTIDATSATIDASSWDTVTLGKSVQVKASRVHDSVTYTDTQSVTTVFSGETGDAAVTGFLTNESFTAPTAEGGDPVLTGGSGNMKIFIGATDDTSNWTFAGDATSNGLVFAVTEATGAYALSGTWTGTTASFDITASKSGYSNVVKTFTVAKSADGDAGKSNTTIYYLQTGFGIPDAPTNGSDETPGAWITTVPTAAIGKSLWFSFGTKPSGSSTWTFTNPQFYLGDLVYTIPGILNINPAGTGLTILDLTTNDYLNDQTTWEDLTDSGSGNANIPADAATNNNVSTGNTAAKNALTGTAGDVFFDTTTSELYIWE